MRIVWGTPTTRGIHPEVVRNIVAFDLNCQEKKHELRLYFPQSSLLTLSRNNIMRDALKWGADWVIMVDDDTQIKDDNFLNKMIETAYKFSASVVGLPVRLGVSDEIIYNFADKHPEKGYVNYRELPKEPKEVDVIGCGVMLINMQWIRDNWPKPPYFTIIDTEIGAWPEDWQWCTQVKERGGKVVVEPRIATVHYKLVGLTF